MTHMPEFVVDTCVVVAVLENEDARHPKGEVEAGRTLLAMAERREVVLRRSTAFDRDWERITDPTKRADRLAWLAASPLAEPVAAGVFRLDVSACNGPDVLGGDEHAELDRELVRVLGRSCNAKSEAMKSSDRDRLLATVRSEAMGLVTVDAATLLKYRVELAALGVNVLWPIEALAHAVKAAVT